MYTIKFNKKCPFFGDKRKIIVAATKNEPYVSLKIPNSDQDSRVLMMMFRRQLNWTLVQDLLGYFPLCQNFRKFRSKRKWNGSVQVEIFRSKWSTSRNGPLWPVGPARPKNAVHFQKFSFPVPLQLVTTVKMADGSDASVYECNVCKLQTQDVNFLLLHCCTQGSGTAVHLNLLFLLVFVSF